MSPQYSRRYLRQRLGRDWLRDTIVGTVSATIAAGGTTVTDTAHADPTMSGEQMYFRHHLRLTGIDGVIHDTRVASFGCASGDFIAGVGAPEIVPVGAVFEVHAMLSPAEKDRALDAVIRDVRVRREIPIESVDGATVYSIPGIVEAENLIENPSVELDINGFTATGTTGTWNVVRTTAFSKFGGWGLVQQKSGFGDVTADVTTIYDMRGRWKSLGKPHIFSVYVPCSLSQTVHLEARMPATTYVGDFGTASGRRLSLRFISPEASSADPQELALVTRVFMGIGVSYTDGWMCEEENSDRIGQPSDYIDGEQLDCIWEGEPHASPSARMKQLDSADLLDVRYLADPTNTANPGERQIPWWKVDTTASEGRELRIAPALHGSQKLIFDVLTTARLGQNDLATVDVPYDDWILAGAAAHCWWLMEQQAPGKEAGMYRERRQEAARLYSRLSQRFQGAISRRVMLDEPW
jgi:hypothetical protein